MDDNKYLTRSSQARLSQVHFKDALDTSDAQTERETVDLAQKSPEYFKELVFLPLQMKPPQHMMGTFI